MRRGDESARGGHDDHYREHALDIEAVHRAEGHADERPAQNKNQRPGLGDLKRIRGGAARRLVASEIAVRMRGHGTNVDSGRQPRSRRVKTV